MPALLLWEKWLPDPNGDDLAETLRGEIRDPLWLVARQWQLGEFTAEDAGSAMSAHVIARSSPLQRIAPPGGPPRPPAAAPLNMTIEQVPAAFDLTLRIETGREWRRMLVDAGKAGAWEAFRQNPLLHFKLRDPEFTPEDPELPSLLEESYAQTLAALGGGRMIDGERLFDLLKDQRASAFLTQPDPAVDALGDQWREWVGARLGLPAGAPRGCWNPERLEYECDAAAADADGSGIGLNMRSHDGHAVDWFSFEQGGRVDPGLVNGLDPSRVTDHRHTFIPAPVTFPGMPRARWWELEDDPVDLTRLQASKTDTGALLLAEFSLLFSNDWLAVPLPLPFGTLAEVRALKVTDAFGVQSRIESIYTKAQDGAWELFQLNTAGKPTGRLLLPPVQSRWVQSPPAEEVIFIRDELANLVWAIEKTVANGMGDGTEGEAAALQLEESLRRLAPPPAAPPEPLQQNDAQAKYRLATAIQPHWIPFIPVRPDPSKPDVALRRAAMPRLIEGQSPTRIRPRTGILRRPATHGNRYDIREEEIPVNGLCLRAVWRRARWIQGEAVTWLAYEKRLGVSPAAGTLQFDQVTTTNNS